MKLYFFAILIVGLILVSGCVSDNPDEKEGNTTAKIGKPIGKQTENQSGGSGGLSSKFTASATKNEVYKEEKFTLAINAESVVGVKNLFFESSHVFYNHIFNNLGDPKKLEKYDCEAAACGSHNCNSEKICSYTIDLQTWNEGVTYEIVVYATDINGKEIGRKTINVKSLPKSVGTTTSGYTPPVCGNNVCDSGETTTTCSTDCKSSSSSDGSVGSSCSTSSDCSGSRVKCRGGTCKKVECTTDSQCGSNKRCSDYVCRTQYI